MNQFFTNFAYMGGFIVTPFLLENVLGYGPAHTGLLSIARPLAFSIAGPIAGYLTVKVGERTNAVVGALFIVASMVALSTVGVGTSDLVIMGALALSGIGMGTASPALAAAIANSVEEKDLGVVSAAQQMVAQVGVVAGIQILLTVQQAREPVVGAAASYHAPTWSAPAWPRSAPCPRCSCAARPRSPRSHDPSRSRNRPPSGRSYAVMSLIFWASATAPGSGAVCCMAISLVMSPCTLILPAMKACMPACGFCSTKIALAVS